MGAGKSTVAEALGTRLEWQVADIDKLIESRERRAIADIFSQDGEAYFRQIEHAVLQELLPQRHTIVATGGGTFVDPASRMAINSDGASIWLNVSFEQVIERLPHNGRRPLAADSNGDAGTVRGSARGIRLGAPSAGRESYAGR